MLATTPYYMHSASHAYLPPIPSPLSPRSANIHGRHQPMSSHDATEKLQQLTPPQTPITNASTAFAKRPVKKAPLPKQDELKQRRRSMFLKKVTQAREDSRFEHRGEDILRLEFMQRQHQWEAERAREAPSSLPDAPEDDYEDEAESELPGWGSDVMQILAPSTQVARADEEVDEVLRCENEELEALLGYMPANYGDAKTAQDRQSNNLWSDDDDYDALFSEVMELEVSKQQSQSSVPQLVSREGDMDLS